MSKEKVKNKLEGNNGFDGKTTLEIMDSIVEILKEKTEELRKLLHRKE